MDGYQILLNVGPTKTKSKYPFIIMNEIQLKNTRRYIELEFIDALKVMRRKNKQIIRGGGSGKKEGNQKNKCNVIFMTF
jgi:hypothetical protein